MNAEVKGGSEKLEFRVRLTTPDEVDDLELIAVG